MYIDDTYTLGQHVVQTEVHSEVQWHIVHVLTLHAYLIPPSLYRAVSTDPLSEEPSLLPTRKGN